MAINKKLIHFNTLEKFKENLKLNEDGTIADDSNILGTSIVFIKDAKLIWTHGQYYGYDSINGDLKERLENIETVIEENELVISRALNELNDTKASISDTLYSTNLGDLAMPNSVGGISAGTTANSLKNKTMTQLLDDLLFPTVYPTYVSPYCTISKSSPTVFEVGSAAPQASSFTTTFNRGNIYLNGVEQNSRAGELISSSSYIYHTSDTEANKTLPSKVALGNTIYYYKAAYSQGPAPLDNKGNAYESLAQGTVTSNTRETNHPNTNKSVTINGTYPWFASTVNSGVYTKQDLVAWNNTTGSMSTGSFTVRAQAKDASKNNRQTFILPREAQTIEVLNTLSGDWEDTKSQWTKETLSNYYLGRTYYKYYLTSSESVGSRSIKATF